MSLTTSSALYSALVAFVLLCSPLTAAPIAFTTNATGNWTSDIGAGGTWSPDGGDHFYPISGDTAQFGNHNITVSTPQVFSGGGNSVGQNPFVTLTSTLTMDGGSFTYNAPGLSIITGSGAWINQGTFNHSTNQTLYLDTTGNFTNSNIMNFTVGAASTNGSMQLRGANTKLINTGTLTSTATGNGAILYEANSGVGATIQNSGILRADGAGVSLQINAPLSDSGGTLSAINGGTVRFNKVGISAGHTTVAGTTYSTSGGGMIELGGLVAQFQGSITGGSDVRLGEDITPSQALSYLDFGSTQITWQDSASQGADVALTGGRVLEFRSPVLWNSPILQTINGSGTLRNVTGNTFTMTSSAALYLRTGATFENNGTIVHSGSGEWRLDGISSGTGTLVNNGTYRATAGARTFNAVTSATAQTFDNPGIVEVDATSGAATFTISALTVLPQFSAGTLTGGTWRVNAVGTNNATLNIDPANAGITTIGAGATVELGQTGTGAATIAELTGLANINGGFFVNGTKIFSSSASGLAIGSTGVVGGTGTISESLTFTGGTLSPGNSAGTLSVTGDVVLDANTQLDFELATPNVVGGPNDLVQVVGNLTLNGTLNVTELSGFGVGQYRLFDYTGSLSGGGLVLNDPRFSLDLSTIGQVNLIVSSAVPEPGMLLMMGPACGILLVIRRRAIRKSAKDSL